MANATVINGWKDATTAYLAIAVAGEGANGSAAEYIGQVPLSQLQGMTNAQIKATLVQAASAQRQMVLELTQPSRTDLGITGSVVV